MGMMLHIVENCVFVMAIKTTAYAWLGNVKFCGLVTH